MHDKPEAVWPVLSDGIFALVAIQLGSIIGRIFPQTENSALHVRVLLAA